jgi:hypothetical protein
MRNVKRIVKLLEDVVNAADMHDEAIVLKSILPGSPDISKRDVTEAVVELRKLEQQVKEVGRRLGELTE